MKKNAKSYLKFSFKKVLIVVGGVIIFIIYVQQYYVYSNENKTLMNSLSLAETALVRAKIIEQMLTKRQQESASIENEINSLKDEIPEDLEVEKFKKDFSNSANSISVEINYLNEKIESYNFHNEAVLNILLVGDVNAVTELLGEQLFGKRFIGGNNLSREDHNKYRVELILISLNYSNEKKKTKNFSESEFCSEIKSNVWLWNFKTSLTEIKVKLESICEELKEYDSTVQKVTELENRIKYIKALLAELKKLMEYHLSNNKRLISYMYKQVDTQENSLN